MTIEGQDMNRDSKTQHITLAIGNEFSDFGFATEEAAALEARAGAHFVDILTKE